MAGEQTNQSSQGDSNQSSQQGGTGQGGGSSSSEGTGGNQSQTNQQAATRPDWAPETVWDAEKSTFKPDALKAEFEAKNELAAFKAAEDSKRLALPQKPEDYKLALPADWKAPEGIEFKLDEADPLFAQARTWAKENNLPQAAFEKGLSMIAASKVADAQMIATARNAEIGKLGVNGTARVTALNTFLDAKGYAPLKGMMVTAEIVTTLEKLVHDMTGGGNFTQRGRDNDAPGKLSDDEYAKLSFSEKRAYAEKHSAAQTH